MYLLSIIKQNVVKTEKNTLPQTIESNIWRLDNHALNIKNHLMILNLPEIETKK